MSLDAIRKRLEAATPGPWTWGEPADTFESGVPKGAQTGGPDLLAPNDAKVIESFGYDDWGLAVEFGDAEFIAHAREDVERLLAVAEAAEHVAPQWPIIDPAVQALADLRTALDALRR